MKKSATELMQEILSAAAIDSILALKAGSKGMSNALLQSINAVHANTTHADLPPELQAAIAANVRSAFTRLMKEGYAVMPSGSAPGPAAPRGDHRKPAPGRPGQPPRSDGRGPVDRTRPPRRSGKPGGRGGPPKR